MGFRCVPFEGHLYAVADVDLRSTEILVATSDDSQRQTLPGVVSNFVGRGVKPILVTNAGIYGTDNRPLGLLISHAEKIHGVNNSRGGRGNFSWDSAIFQIRDDDTASIISAHVWRDDPHIIAATQSGPELSRSGKINASFRADSQWYFRRTAVGIDKADSRIVHLAVSREAVSLFELASFMVNGIQCSEALHLDGDLSAFYIPSTSEKFVFSDPGERIVTALAVVQKTNGSRRGH